MRNPRKRRNAEGKAELNSGNTQKLKIICRKTMLNKDRDVLQLYTIRTMDGKSLSGSGTPVGEKLTGAQLGGVEVSVAEEKPLRQ